VTGGELAAWAEAGHYLLRDYGDGTYKLSCAHCGPILRDVTRAEVEEYAREYPANPCRDLPEWEHEVTP
jgi:hypothetical protein